MIWEDNLNFIGEHNAAAANGEHTYTVHSELRPNYPTPKIPKNCTRLDIKSGNSPRCGKVREGQKSGCFPGSKRENGQKPNWTKLTKMDLLTHCSRGGQS